MNLNSETNHNANTHRIATAVNLPLEVMQSRREHHAPADGEEQSKLKI